MVHHHAPCVLPSLLHPFQFPTISPRALGFPNWNYKGYEYGYGYKWLLAFFLAKVVKCGGSFMDVVDNTFPPYNYCYYESS
jgi:hypothetical protein